MPLYNTVIWTILGITQHLDKGNNFSNTSCATYDVLEQKTLQFIVFKHYRHGSSSKVRIKARMGNAHDRTSEFRHQWKISSHSNKKIIINNKIPNDKNNCNNFIKHNTTMNEMNQNNIMTVRLRRTWNNIMNIRQRSLI